MMADSVTDRIRAAVDYAELLRETGVAVVGNRGLCPFHDSPRPDHRRKPGFVIWFIIVPLSMIVLLSNAVFWLDRELIGNRLDILFIALLTIVAYQSLAAESLPSVSYFTLINAFIYIGTVLSLNYLNLL